MVVSGTGSQLVGLLVAASVAEENSADHSWRAPAIRPKRHDVLARTELAPVRADCSSPGNAATVPSCPQGRQGGSLG